MTRTAKPPAATITTRPASLALIASIIEQLTDKSRAANHVGSNLDFIDAVFFQRGRKRPIGSLSVVAALASLANDVTRFEKFDLMDADRVEVRS